MIAIATLDFELKSDGSYTSTIRLGHKTDDTYGTWNIVRQSRDQATVQLTPNNGTAKTTDITLVDKDTFNVALGEAKEFGSFLCKRQKKS